MYDHTELKRLYGANPSAEVYYFDNGCWSKCQQHPVWDQNVPYKVVLPEYMAAWQAYLDGELIYFKDGTWVNWQDSMDVPIFCSGHDNYKRSRWSEERRLLRNEPESQVYMLQGPKWVLDEDPDWGEETLYRVITPNKKEGWEAWLDGVLQVYQDEWRDTGTYNHNLPPDHYRRKPVRAHRDLIIKWANDPNAVVWVREGEWWRQVDCVSWSPDNTYMIVLPEYEEAWQAYLDDALEILVDQKWIKVQETPNFDKSPSYYRRKRITLRYVRVDGKLGEVKVNSYEVINDN